MLSSGYFRYRWSYYRPIFERRDDPAVLCQVDTSKLPIRTVGEDAREYVPYAVHPELTKSVSLSIRRLHDYMERYVIRGEKVSAHQLPVPDAASRAMMQHLRAVYPHLSSHLLHHWCADAHGGVALYRALQGLWEQAWRQERKDQAPWSTAVNILLLKLLRTTIAQLPTTHAAQVNHVMTSVIGGAYLWALQRFLEKNSEHAEAERISRHEALVIPATPIAFFHQQRDELFADAPHLVLAYGLEPDLAPRMRDIMRNAPGMAGKEVLARLAGDRLGDHMLKRSWARLCLWDLAASSGHGSWMRWALDAKRLDQLLTRTKELADLLEDALEPLRGHLFADWLLAQMRGGSKTEPTAPWREDLRTVMAFRVFDADIKVETARRKAERMWLDRYDVIVGKGRGDEASRALDGAFHAGKIVLLQPDFDQPLHSGGSGTGAQACLRVDWTDTLRAMSDIHGSGMQDFLTGTFMPGTLKFLGGREGVFLDEYGASGCVLRGEPFMLLRAGLAMRHLLQGWYMDVQKNEVDGDGLPVLSMCLALAGDWSVATLTHPRFGKIRMAYAPALGEAMRGVTHASRSPSSASDEKGLRPLGGVMCGSGDVDNRGFVVTAEALNGLLKSARASAEVTEYRAENKTAQATLSGYALPDGDFHALLIREGDIKDAMDALIVRIGRASFGGGDGDLFEVLDIDAPVARLILSEGASKWAV